MSMFGRSLSTWSSVLRFQSCSKLSHVNTCRPFSAKKKLTSLDFKSLKNKGKKLTMVTAYDYPTGMHAENAEFDLILVGDSLGMVILGHETTQTVTMDEMIHHCKATRRGAPNTFIIGDMPFGSYEVNTDDAVRNAFRFLKESGMDAVKLEGARPETVRRIVDSGIAVMGHIGLTPQGISVLGGFRAQGRTAVKAFELVQNAVKLEKAGAFALVVECVPSVVAKAVQEAVSIPVIGIGAGPHTAGQVLVYHDLLGIMHHPHHEKHVPSFCKRYANFGEAISSSLEQFRDEVRSQAFPSEEFSPYKMSAEEQQKFQDLLLSGSTEHSSVEKNATTSSAGDNRKVETELLNETIKVY